MYAVQKFLQVIYYLQFFMQNYIAYCLMCCKGAKTSYLYSTYLFGEGAFLSCDKNNYENQYTTNYDPEASAGIDKFYTKQGKVLHPNGLSLAVDQIAKESPTYAELGKSANYSLKFNTKNVKMGLIKSKVGTAVV